MYPLVKELAKDGIPVKVSCRVLKLSRQPYYRWLKQPIGERELDEAYRANALYDAHVDDPEFGHRLLADEARAAGQPMSDRTAWRICARQGWWSVFGKRKATGKNQRPGPAVHDDLVKREFTAETVNKLWLTDITEHHTSEGKLYLCAIKDVCSNRIVGYSISDRMQSRLAVDALENAVARRDSVAGCVVHSDRGSQGGFNWLSQHPDDGGVQEWRRKIGPRKPVMRPRWCVGSGVRIGRYGPRCDLLVDRSLPGQFSASFGV